LVIAELDKDVSVTSPLQLGVIGCGWIAETQHLPALQGLPQIRVIAAADPNETRLNALTARYTIAQKHKDYESLLANIEVDAVAILTPPTTHREIITAALEAGKHVFIEKPLAMTLDDCDAIQHAAENEPHLKVLVGFNLRWHRLTLKAHSMKNQLGQPTLINSRFLVAGGGADTPEWRTDPNGGGDTLTDLGVHHFDLWRALTGDEIERVHAAASENGFSAAISAVFRSGTAASAVFSQRSINANTIEFFARSGSLSLDFYRFDGLNFTAAHNAAGGFGMLARKTIKTVISLPQAIKTTPRGGDFSLAYRTQLEHFAACILENKPPACTIADGRAALEVAVAAAESLRTGEVVPVEQQAVATKG
jgi:myo-inositol 2-dehydrogenase/D-chiro-inositol 1-dehydrogenase